MGFAFAKAVKATQGLKRDIERFLDNVENGLIEAKKKLASEAAHKLIFYSPVWTSDYVQSFRVGIGVKDPSYTLTHDGLPPWPPRLPESEAEIIKQQKLMEMLAKIASSGSFDEIVLSNSIPYASEVEFVGSMYSGGQPYFVFIKTTGDVALIASKLNAFMKEK